MPIVKAHTRSFAGGEITPELYGRLDLTKFQTGLAQCLNFEVMPHGPVQNSSGFTYVNEAKDSSKVTRLIPFSYNTQQTYAIEFGDQYIRWHTNGGTLLSAAQNITGITQANPAVITYAGADPTNGTWMYVTGIVGMTQLNGRYVKVANVNAGANTFEATDLGDSNIDSSSYTAWSSGGTVAPVYEIASTYLEADLMDLHFTQSEDVLTITHPSYPPRQLSRSAATSWAIANISFVPTIATPAAPAVAATVAAGADTNYYYKTTAVAADTLEESLASAASVAVSNHLATAGNYNTITPAAVAGSVRHNVYKLLSGLYGYVGQTDVGTDFIDNNITPDLAKTPAIVNTPFGSATNYPNGVGYYESRRIFAGTTTKPQNYWLTRSATESNLSYSIPTRDDDTIQGRLKGNEVNSIRHIVATNEQLVFLTSGGPWKLTPANSDILTPTSAAPKQIPGEGASNVQPAKTATDIVYIGEAETRMYSVKYKWESNGLITEELSLMAPHLFEGYTFSDKVSYSKGQKTLWSVRSDGKLVGTTYLPQHEVNAMFVRDTDGLFESTCAVKEGAEYPLYAIVKRTLNGRTVRCVERKHTRYIGSIEDSFFVDCGITYDSTPATTFYAWHLIGETVAILADGAEVAQQVVASDGTITLADAASVVHVGLPITADIEGLPLVIETLMAAGQANLKNVSEVLLRVKDSGGIKVGPDFDHLRELPARSNEAYDTPPALKNGVVRIVIDNSWGIDSRVCLRQTAPLPLTISAMTLVVATGG